MSKNSRTHKSSVPDPLSLVPTAAQSSLALAISSIIAGTAPAYAQEAPARATGALEEVIVTATKRTENIQDIPQSVQAISAEDLQRQDMMELEDYSRFVPSMSYFATQPGAGKVFFRGVADAPDTFIAESSAAIYLDEQPLTQSAQVDVRLVDIERVEALSGPQGTLYGSSSQSGTLRIVTNKPDPTGFAAQLDVGLKTGSDSDESYDFSGMVNIPVVEDKFALRIVGFTSEEGGFIDNVLGTTPVCESDVGRCDAGGPQMNTSVVESNWNNVELSGGRVSGRWFANEDWTVTGAVAFQDTTANAENTYDPTVGDLQVISFAADVFEDEWTQFALTIEGDLGWANFISATSYFDRDSSYVQDTTSYAAYFGTFCYDFTTTGTGGTTGVRYSTRYTGIYCFQPSGMGVYYGDPIGTLLNDQNNNRISQEFRLSNTTEKWDWVAGFFWEDHDEDWDFTTTVPGYSTSQGMRNWITPGDGSVYMPGPGNCKTPGLCAGGGWGVPATPSDVWWFSADRTNWETYALFGDVTFNFNDQWSVTAGGRFFSREMDKTYWVELPAGRLTPALSDKHGCTFEQAQAAPGGVCNFLDSTDPNDIGITNPTSDEDDFAGKFAVRYRPTDDAMLYGLFSEGFRPGGTNRGRGLPFFPQLYENDFLQNIEVGAKTQWADGRLQLNGTFFFMSWDDYQLEVIDPSNVPCGSPGSVPAPTCGQPWQKVITNAGNASIDGFELQAMAVPAEGLEFSFNATWQDAEIDQDVPEIGVVKGDTLPFAPEFKASAIAQYSWPTTLLGSNSAFVNLSWSHVGDSLNQVQPIPIPTDVFQFGQNAPQVEQKSYDQVDLKVGLVGDMWEVNLFGKNIGDERGQVYHDVTDFEWYWVNTTRGSARNRTAIIRPAEWGVRFIKRWGQ